MTYPPKPHRELDAARISAHIRAYPFAHIFSGTGTDQRVTRLPFAYDGDGEGGLLRGHMDANNPQANHLDGGEVLIAFSGPNAYVSPNWRSDRTRGATWDYTAVHVWGRVRLRQERAFFAQLINDLSAPLEERFEALSPHPRWSFADAPEAYVDRLFPHLRGFEVEITRIEAITKVHQDFAPKDAYLVADHLAESPEEGGRQIAALIREKTAARHNKA